MYVCISFYECIYLFIYLFLYLFVLIYVLEELQEDQLLLQKFGVNQTCKIYVTY